MSHKLADSSPRMRTTIGHAFSWYAHTRRSVWSSHSPMGMECRIRTHPHRVTL